MDLLVGGLKIPVEKDVPDEYLKAAAGRLGIDVNDVKLIEILAKALDTGDPGQFYYELTLAAGVPDSFENKDNLPLYTPRPRIAAKPTKMNFRPIVIGFGPAGMFASLELLERGLKPLIFERGRMMEKRNADILKFIKERKLDSESNIQFGEGGAGAYSDGKLFSRANNSVYADKVLETFVKFGAPPEILYAAKPHLGTDVLTRITVNIRNHILKAGGEIYFGSKMTGLIVKKGRVDGVLINGENAFHSSYVYLAVGHSARDTFEMLHGAGVEMEQKPVSVGVRIEHPAAVINLIRYGEKYKAFEGLGAALYSFNHTDRSAGRGVYTFCMCPGGEIVNASSENGLLAVNGMSYHSRSSVFSNSALAVTCHTSDYGSDEPLAGIEFQRNIERKAFEAGGGAWKAPAQNLVDFLEGRASRQLIPSSFRMGLEPADISAVLPEFAVTMLKNAFAAWKKDYPLFVSEQALLIAAETRTSCPVRIKRDDKYGSVSVKGLCPIGEGAGFAGGITSSAADAIKAVEASLPF